VGVCAPSRLVETINATVSSNHVGYAELLMFIAWVIKIGHSRV
jgi:hypothetical protein